jgi:hypothetical protein
MLPLMRFGNRSLPAVVIASAFAFSMLPGRASAISYGEFDLPTGLTSSTDASVMIHFTGVESGITRPLLVLESGDGAEILRVEYNGNSGRVYLSDGPGRPKPSWLTWGYGALLVIRLHGDTYEAALSDQPFLLHTNVNAAPVRAWSNRGAATTIIKFHRIVFVHSDLVATTFGDSSYAGWTHEGSPLGAGGFDGGIVADRSLGYGWISAPLLPETREMFTHPLSVSGSQYRASVSFLPSPYLDEFSDGIAPLAGLRDDGGVAWAVILRSTGERQWDVWALDGDGSSNTIASIDWVDCAPPPCDPWNQWHALDLQVDDATGSWTVSIDGAAFVSRAHGSGATRIGFGDVLGGLPIAGPSGGGSVRVDNLWAAREL